MRRCVALATLAVFLPLADPAPAAVRDCTTWAYYPNVKISSARNMTCRAAARDFKRCKCSVRRRFWTPGGFLCARQSGGSLGGQWRCVNRSRAYRFEFGD
jgi:hypothetical protein